MKNHNAMLLSTLVAAGLAVATATAGEFDGKQMKFYTMGSPGGGYDTYMRTMIPHLEKKLGADLLPLNESGAGGLVAMNRTITAPPDGATILLTSGEGVVTGQLYGVSGVRYDVKKLVWVARVSGDSKVVLISPKSPHKTFADVLKSERPFIWGGSGKTDGNSDYSAILCHALAFKCRIILGYKGSGGMNLAIENGEIDSRIVTDEAGARFVRSGKMRAIATLTRDRAGPFPDVPTVFEVAKPSAGQAKWLDWRAGIASLGRVIVTTPGTPKARIDALRAAFKDLLTDKAFIAEAAKRKLQVNYASGSEVEKMVSAAMDTLDAKELAEVKDIVLNRYYGGR